MAGKGKNDGPAPRMNHVRAFVLEATMTDEGLSQLTQALSGFIRPAVPLGRIAPGPVAAISASPVSPSQEVQNGDESSDGEVVEEDVASTPTASAARAPRRERRYPVPEYLSDVDLNAGNPPFKEYVAGAKANKHSKRFLLVASWFREHGNRATVTVDHAYTCYKKAGWAFNGLADWDLVFRQLVKQDRMRRVESGEYAITPHGEDMVNEILKADQS